MKFLNKYNRFIYINIILFFFILLLDSVTNMEEIYIAIALFLFLYNGYNLVDKFIKKWYNMSFNEIFKNLVITKIELYKHNIILYKHYKLIGLILLQSMIIIEPSIYDYVLTFEWNRWMHWLSKNELDDEVVDSFFIAFLGCLYMIFIFLQQETDPKKKEYADNIYDWDVWRAKNRKFFIKKDQLYIDPKEELAAVRARRGEGKLRKKFFDDSE